MGVGVAGIGMIKCSGLVGIKEGEEPRHAAFPFFIDIWVFLRTASTQAGTFTLAGLSARQVA